MPVKVAGSLAAVAVATGLVYALRPIAPTLSLGVVYTLAVLATAVVFGLGYAIAVAVVSMLTFNFLFLPPVHTFALSDGQNWTALVVYLVTAVVASELATAARRRAVLAEQREREAELLSDAAATLLQEEPLDEIQERARQVFGSADPAAHERFDAAMESLLAMSEVRRSDAIKTVILQTVSHDFRTPLATMQAAVGGLEDPELQLSAADRLELLETIRLETERLSRLVENVLDLSRIQAGAAAPRPALWAVDDLLGQAAAEASDPTRLHVHVPDGLPAAHVDAVQLQRVLANLIENALKFGAGNVDLTAHVAGTEVVVDIVDRGQGASARPGLGLGLAIAHGFTEANGGTLVLEPREGGGTRARLTLPAQPVPAELAR